MKKFEYMRPETLEGAAEEIKNGGVAMAGGSDLLGGLKADIYPQYPEKIVSLKGIKNLEGIQVKDGTITVKAMTRLSEIAENKEIKKLAPALAEAAKSVATPLVRNLGTIGGNVCQDVRCWFYRYPDEIGGRLNCARKGGEQCYGILGDNRYHSIFGGMSTGKTPCAVECPAGTDIPAYMAQIRKGNWEEAAKIIMQYKEVAGGICAPKGFAAAGVHCGIRANHAEKYDLALIKADVRCAAAGVYTTNKVCGAPIKVDRAHLKDGYAQAIIVNSGNANTCAANGVALAEECCELVGKELGIDPQDVLPASTGVIGQPMVIDPFARGIPAAAAKLAADEQGSADAATAIMTTDTHKKEYAIQFELGGKTCTVGAIGKGSGMIAPNMATMLAFYTTDAAVSPILLEKALKTVVPGTYNQMSVDLDTSTNDTLIIMASGLAGNPEICEENADYEAFVAALTAIAEHMCAEHAGDGEGATHLITCEVTHAPDLKTARAVSRSVVCSNLFKAAVFGRDANWGRILCAIGYTPGDFSIDKVCVWLSSKAGEVYVCENAAYHPYSEDEAAKVLAEHDVLVKVDMGTGDASAKAWGCDLTYDYVKINGDYRT